MDYYTSGKDTELLDSHKTIQKFYKGLVEEPFTELNANNSYYNYYYNYFINNYNFKKFGSEKIIPFEFQGKNVRLILTEINYNILKNLILLNDNSLFKNNLKLRIKIIKNIDISIQKLSYLKGKLEKIGYTFSEKYNYVKSTTYKPLLPKKFHVFRYMHKLKMFNYVPTIRF
jgi:hypothetical protein